MEINIKTLVTKDILELNKFLGEQYSIQLNSTPLEHLSDKWNAGYLLKNSSILIKELSVNDKTNKEYDIHAFSKARTLAQPRTIRNIRMKKYASEGGSCFGLDISRDSITGKLVLLLRIWILYPSKYFKTILPADVYSKEYTSRTYDDFILDVRSLQLETEVKDIFAKIEERAMQPAPNLKMV